MFFFSNCVSLLGVLCLLLLATSSYCTIDCPSIKSSVDSILSIGPWNNSLAVLSTDLQLFQAKMLQSPPRLQLSSPQSLAVLEPKLYGVLHEQSLSASDNLIQVNSAIEPTVLLAVPNGRHLVINPSDGVKSPLNPAAFLPGAVWLSSLTDTFYAFSGQTIQIANYGNPQITVTSTVYLSYKDNSVQRQSTSAGTGSWQIKKAFNWQRGFYVLTQDAVYFFEENVLTNEGSQVVLKIPYKQFFNCTLSKEEEVTTNESRKTKVETIKREVTRAHLTTSLSSVTTTPRWLNILLFTFFGICLLCIVVWAGLCTCWMPKRKPPLKGGRVILPGDIDFDGGLVHIPSKSGEPKVAGPISPTKEQPALRVATKMNPEMVKKIAARKALKRASSGQSGLKGKGESNRQVKSATAIKTK